MQLNGSPNFTLKVGDIDQIILRRSISLDQALARGSCPRSYTAAEGFATWFRDEVLWLTDNQRQVAKILNLNPSWKRGLQDDAQASEEESGLPIIRRERAMEQLQKLVDEGHLLSDAPDRWSPPPGPRTLVIRGRKKDSTGEASFLVSGEQMFAIELASSNGELHEFSDAKAMSTWLGKKIEANATVQPAPQRVRLQDIGGLGELLSWRAVIPGSAQPATPEEIANHPAPEWLSGLPGALCRETEGYSEERDPVRSSAQRICIGSMVYAGATPQDSRLRRHMKPLDLYRPASPYGRGVAPMGGLA